MTSEQRRESARLHKIAYRARCKAAGKKDISVVRVRAYRARKKQHLIESMPSYYMSFMAPSAVSSLKPSFAKQSQIYRICNALYHTFNKWFTPDTPFAPINVSNLNKISHIGIKKIPDILKILHDAGVITVYDIKLPFTYVKASDKGKTDKFTVLQNYFVINDIRSWVDNRICIDMTTAYEKWMYNQETYGCPMVLSSEALRPIRDREIKEIYITPNKKRHGITYKDEELLHITSDSVKIKCPPTGQIKIRGNREIHYFASMKKELRKQCKFHGQDMCEIDLPSASFSTMVQSLIAGACPSDIHWSIKDSISNIYDSASKLHIFMISAGPHLIKETMAADVSTKMGITFTIADWKVGIQRYLCESKKYKLGMHKPTIGDQGKAYVIYSYMEKYHNAIHRVISSIKHEMWKHRTSMYKWLEYLEAVSISEIRNHLDHVIRVHDALYVTESEYHKAVSVLNNWVADKEAYKNLQTQKPVYTVHYTKG